MSNLGKLRRLYLLVEKIENAFHPTFDEIYDYYYEHGFEISKRTIQRDIETLRIEFGIEITYDRFREGYYVDRSRSLNVNSFFRFLEYANTADLLSENIRQNKNNLEYIHFESQGKLKNLHLLKELMFAIRNNRSISFTHYNFSKETRKSFTVYPYGLKEYQSRWYVVGMVENIDNPLKFGIDRIEELNVHDQTFEKDPHFDMNDLFDDVVGLRTDREKEEILLHFTPFQGKYIKTLPLHPSQEVVEEDDQGVTVKLKVRPNFELKQKLMMQCQAVKVIQPQWLAEEMQEIYREALENYKK